jgi:hypothetical protein
MIPADINREFERLLCEYTGAPYAIVVDNCCSALFLCLRWWMRYCKNDYDLDQNYIRIPKHTYIGVPYAIRAAYLIPQPLEQDVETGFLKGEYPLCDTGIWDSALRFTSDMYRSGQMQCLSFTGPYKHLKLGKGGAILLDNKEAYDWIMRASFSGRNQCSYHEDTFDMPEGYNMYMPHTIAAHGVHMMQGFPKHNDDLCLKYPDWSVHPAFK